MRAQHLQGAQGQVSLAEHSHACLLEGREQKTSVYRSGH